MKTASRFFTLFLVLTLAFSFSACSYETDTEAREEAAEENLSIETDGTSGLFLAMTETPYSTAGGASAS